MPHPLRMNLDDVPAKEIMPGFFGKMIHTETMTLAYWDIKENSSLPEHHHVHHQVVNMLEGEFELTVDGVPHRLKPGDVLVLESNVPHSGRAITDCKILDVFEPVRTDYQ